MPSISKNSCGNYKSNIRRNRDTEDAMSYELYISHLKIKAIHFLFLVWYNPLLETKKKDQFWSVSYCK